MYDGVMPTEGQIELGDPEVATFGGADDADRAATAQVLASAVAAHFAAQRPSLTTLFAKTCPHCGVSVAANAPLARTPCPRCGTPFLEPEAQYPGVMTKEWLAIRCTPPILGSAMWGACADKRAAGG